jgi:hypothetical protein
MPSSRKCVRCKSRPRRSTHFNTRWCEVCRQELLRRPKGTLTPEQRAYAIRHAGDMSVPQIAKHLGTSTSNVKRSCRGVRFYAQNGKYKHRPELVRRVLSFYFQHGMPATVEAFPNVNVKCIVDRPEYYGIARKYRQTRWTSEQLVALAQMAGLVSQDAQARFFSRPGANAGSIQSAWMKRFRQGGANINGASWWMARKLVGERCQPIQTGYWKQRPGSKRGEFSRQIVLWTDLVKHLDPDQPDWIREAIEALANFQRWLHGVEHVRPKVIRLIRERENHGQ